MHAPAPPMPSHDDTACIPRDKTTSMQHHHSSLEYTSFASSIPPPQGLYDPVYEKDACGVGFLVSIQGLSSHALLKRASSLLCNMTHRGAVGCDDRDGDGAGVMTSLPISFFRRHFRPFLKVYPRESEVPALIDDPNKVLFATGNIFFGKSTVDESKSIFTQLATSLGLIILDWRQVPTDASVLGPSAAATEPIILQPAIAQIKPQTQDDFERKLYLLRKRASHKISLSTSFYICSLSTKIIIYKGLLSPNQLYRYFPDLRDEEYTCHFALVHSRFSTNTFPSWNRAQPMRWTAHNGEINTLKGNKAWMRSREGVLSSAAFTQEALESLFPVIEEGGSDSSALDNVLELLYLNGQMSLPQALLMMIPEAWQNQQEISPEKKAFYEYSACLMEPWDGPALFTFSDGRYVGATLDRNGLRPCRYYTTVDGIMICASEVGTLSIDPATITSKGRLEPGKMLLVDTFERRIVNDCEIKSSISSKFPFQEWVAKNLIAIESEPSNFSLSTNTQRFEEVLLSAHAGEQFWRDVLDPSPITQDTSMSAFGLSMEQLEFILSPMILDGKEALGSMGTDVSLACMSANARPLFDYFRQLFAQVTNPPIDPIREDVVMSLSCYIGPMTNILKLDEQCCHRLRIDSPILTKPVFRNLLHSCYENRWNFVTLDCTWEKEKGVKGLEERIDEICAQVSAAIENGCKLVILSDLNVSANRVPVSSIAVVGAVHTYLVNNRQRSRISLVVATGDARDVHAFCVLLGYGADAIYPWLAFEAMHKMNRDGLLQNRKGLTLKDLQKNYVMASNNGIKKVMSKMGISTLSSYKGAQIFEALGIHPYVVSKCFRGTSSRISGVGFDLIAYDLLTLHEKAYPSGIVHLLNQPILAEVGDFHWRRGGEVRINDPSSIAFLQDAVRQKNKSAYDSYATLSHDQIKECTLRGLLDFNTNVRKSIPIDEVEPWTSIVKRFVTGAMSYGSISMEAHSTLALAMNALGGKSNTGEGGEDPERSTPSQDGSSKRSAIKQVASGRFGVTSYYLSDAEELQIKLAQGAKPGEGGELPGHKVSEGIAKTRKSTPGVGLISPPPHHDIYSIEDLKQLIFDLKSSNPVARISVKLVSEVGVGIVASGVVKAKADHILISGHDGGTGASRWTGIQHAGLPWELGLAETHQTLVMNNLRDRVVVQTDGQIKTGRDVAIACLLGAEEWGFATTPLIAMGCTMMRKCHLNSCPVGIATQDPELRAKFQGKPEHVINFFYYVASEMREIMAHLGFATVSSMVGRVDCLKPRDGLMNAKQRSLDLSALLRPSISLYPTYSFHGLGGLVGRGQGQSVSQGHDLEMRLDWTILTRLQSVISSGSGPVVLDDVVVKNTDRAFGTMISYHVSKRWGEQGLSPGTIILNCVGSAGQSLGAFLASGITLRLAGDANDYVGKGLSGGVLVIYPPTSSTFEAATNVIAGNVCLYGATAGEAYFCGKVAERFAVRNSGALAVVEAVGDHGCEYMTGGRVIILGSTGRNFAAGMSGGLAFVLDEREAFEQKCNMATILLEPLDGDDVAFIKETLRKHIHYTKSEKAHDVLDRWDSYYKSLFVKVYPIDYKAAVHKKLADSTKLAEKSIVSTEIALAVDDSLSKSEITLLDASTPSISLKVEEASVADIEDNFINGPSLKLDKLKGFIKYKRSSEPYRSAKSRTSDWEEVSARLDKRSLMTQTSRCMDCGVPFCQSESGCPIGNIIPKWNDLVFKGRWREAYETLQLTNNFPEFTGRVCPAPCEGACVLGINEDPVNIKSIECAIIDHAFKEGWVVPNPPVNRTGKRIAIVGSGPAGLSAADQLNKAGHSVTVFDRNDRIGGLLMYGIPNMKLDKRTVQRRIDLLAAECVVFRPGCNVGVDVDVRSLVEENDALLLCTGATWPRDLNIPNRHADGIYFAMDFLSQNTKSLLDSQLADEKSYISAKGKNVIVIGGGDTGNDCIGTSVRHGAKSIVNFELLPKPPASRSPENPWPQYPRVFRVDYGHSEVKVHYGEDPRKYCVLSKSFTADENGHVTGIQTVLVEWTQTDGRWSMTEVPGSDKFYPADMVLISMGFLGPEKQILSALEIEQDPRSNVKTPKGRYETNVPKVFAAGDCRRGQSLVVWGIQEGRLAAREVDAFLMDGKTRLPSHGGVVERALAFLEKAALGVTVL